MLTFNKHLRPHLYFAPDDGGNAGDPAGGKDPDPSGENKNDGGKGGEGDKQFSQADIDRIVADRLERERKKSEAAAQKLKDESEAAALAEQQKWQELAQKHEKTIADLTAKLAESEALKETFGNYETVVKKYLETERAGLPEHIVALLDKLDPVAQLEYISTNKDSLKPNRKPLPETPDPDDKGLTEAQKADAKKQTDLAYRNLFQ